MPVPTAEKLPVMGLLIVAVPIIVLLLIPRFFKKYPPLKRKDNEFKGVIYELRQYRDMYGWRGKLVVYGIVFMIALSVLLRSVGLLF